MSRADSSLFSVHGSDGGSSLMHGCAGTATLAPFGLADVPSAPDPFALAVPSPELSSSAGVPPHGAAGSGFVLPPQSHHHPHPLLHRQVTLAEGGAEEDNDHLGGLDPTLPSLQRQLTEPREETFLRQQFHLRSASNSPSGQASPAEGLPPGCASHPPASPQAKDPLRPPPSQSRQQSDSTAADPPTPRPAQQALEEVRRIQKSWSQFREHQQELEVQKREDRERSRDCVCCCSSERTVVFLPCAHMCACLACSQQVKECPLCRAKIVNSIRVFF